MLNNEDKELVATLLQEEASRTRRLLKEVTDLYDEGQASESQVKHYDDYLKRLTEVLSRVLFYDDTISLRR